MTEVIDHLARQMLVDHEKLCIAQMQAITYKLNMIISVGGWAGALMAVSILGSLGYLAKAQIDHTQQQLDAIHNAEQVVLKRSHEVEDNEARIKALERGKFR